LVASALALDPDGAFSLCWERQRTQRRPNMDRRKKDLEAENEELWQRLEDVYDRLRELFDTNDSDGEAGDE